MAALMSVVELLANSIELSPFELSDCNSPPSFTGADQSRLHQLQHRTLAEEVRHHLGAAALLPEQALEQVGGADHLAMIERKAQLSDAGLEVILEARQRRGELG